MIDSDNNKKIFEQAKNTILKLHPVVDNKISILRENSNPELDIEFNFYEEDNDDRISVEFLLGTVLTKIKNTEHTFIIDGLLNKEIFIDLVKYILSDHEIVTDFDYNNNKIKLSFDVNWKEDSLKGIDFNTINLKFDFTKCKNKEDLLDLYLYYIIDNFYDNIKNTPVFKRDFNEFINECKKNLINRTPKEKLIDMLNLLSEEDVRKLIYNIPNDQFADVYEEYDKTLVKTLF